MYAFTPVDSQTQRDGHQKSFTTRPPLERVNPLSALAQNPKGPPKAGYYHAFVEKIWLTNSASMVVRTIFSISIAGS